MKSFNHLKFLEFENKIIEKNSSYPGLAHNFSDSGKLSGKVTSYKWHILRISEYKKLKNIDFNHTNVFFSLFVSPDYDFDSPFFSKLSEFLLKNKGKVVKADTTKSPFDFSFIVICVCKCKKDLNNSYYGSLDSFIEGVHFRKGSNAYKNSELSAVSDVLTRNVKLINIYSLNFNSFNNESFFSKSEKESISFFDKEIYVHLAVGLGKELNYKINLGDNIYLIGYAGYSRFLNYNLEFDYLYKNIISIRERVFKILKGKFISSDISDGFEITLKNLMMNNGNYNIKIDYDALLRHCKKINKNINLDHIKTGGDDYSLIMISEEEIDDDDVEKIGKVL